jgi:LemA protein
MKYINYAYFFLIMILISSCSYNKLQGLDEDVKANFSEIQNQYQRRFDLIPNLVETVKAYASHEKETLEAVVLARSKVSQVNLNADSLANTEAINQFQSAQNNLGQALSRLMVVVERYPDLKANENFRDLQVQLEGTENRIAVARKRYIEAVSNYNKAVRYFPSNITAKYILKMEPMPNFTLENQEAQSAPKVEF